MPLLAIDLIPSYSSLPYEERLRYIERLRLRRATYKEPVKKKVAKKKASDSAKTNIAMIAARLSEADKAKLIAMLEKGE